jgi:UDP-N-acetylmuramyl pentapeptide phosphotransferase/UDP-N-acetylglucosamine-1-phosphate transferase
MDNPIAILIVGSAAALMTGLGVSLLRQYAVQHGFLSHSHAHSTPNGGGLALVAVVLMLFMPFGLGMSADPSLVVRFSLAAALMAFIGFYEDFRTLPRPLRLLLQMAAALFFVPSAPLTSLALPALNIELPLWLGYLIATAWLVGLTNVYVYMDGINGLASGQAVLAAGFWALIGALCEAPLVTFLGILISGSALGFTLHNLPPRNIFLGETGSSFLGFSLAALPLMCIGQGESPRLFISGILVMSLFTFDALLTFVRYLLAGGEERRANRSHLYQRLLQLGDRPLHVLRLYLLLSAGFGMAGLLYWQAAAPSILFAVGMVCLTLYAWIKRRETRDNLFSNTLMTKDDPSCP